MGAVSDLLVAALFTFLLAALLKGEVAKYLAALCVMTWVHAIGNVAQAHELGPAWAQGHLHNGGVAASITLFVLCIRSTIYCIRNRSVTIQAARADLVRLMLAWLPRVYMLATACLIAFEVLLVTVSRNQMIRRGYSGDLDIGDIIAYVLSLALILISHAWRAPHVRAWAGITKKTKATR